MLKLLGVLVLFFVIRGTRIICVVLDIRVIWVVSVVRIIKIIALYFHSLKKSCKKMWWKTGWN